MVILVVLQTLGAARLQAQLLPGLPEPGLVIYGAITTTNGSPPFYGSGIFWNVASGTNVFAGPATLVSVNGQLFYMLRVVFETRNIPGTPSFAATPNTLELLATAATYTRSATVNGTNATLQGSGSFTFGLSDRGRVDRVDLTVAPGRATFAQWLAQYGLAANTDPNADPLHKGMTYYQQYIAGTNPLDPNSVFELTNIQPGVSGGITLQWSSVIGQTYSVLRSSNLGTNFTQVGTAVFATNTLAQYYDPTAIGHGPYFYRISVQ